MSQKQEETLLDSEMDLITAMAASINWTPICDGPSPVPVSCNSRGKQYEATYYQEMRFNCTLCDEEKPSYKLEKLPCGHFQCHDCLRENYKVILDNPEYYPPKCCKDLDITSTSFVLSIEDLERLEELRQAKEAKRIVDCAFCSRTLIDVSIEDENAYCMKCDQITCAKCGSKAHKDICPTDPGTRQLLELVQREGWSRCPRCRMVVEREDGCDHMECVCGAMFCYRCGGDTSEDDCLCAQQALLLPEDEFGEDDMGNSYPEPSNMSVTFGEAFEKDANTQGSEYPNDVIDVEDPYERDVHDPDMPDDSQSEFQSDDTFGGGDDDEDEIVTRNYGEAEVYNYEMMLEEHRFSSHERIRNSERMLRRLIEKRAEKIDEIQIIEQIMNLRRQLS
ncbi:hypothetical protein ABW20_dc0104487 [Dactylellina cionopaga]|nr:hypothetical protein ABW20_dc0104487 [Dactylellina cionopaga]